jgi:hypothetical protein
VLAVLLLVAACGREAPAPVAAIPEVALPVLTSAVVRPKPGIEVTISADGVWLDPRPWYGALPAPPERPIAPGLVLALFHYEPATPFSHELALPRLADALAAVVGEAPAPPVLLRAPAEAPHALVQRAIYAVSMASLPGLDLAVAGAGGRTLTVPMRFPEPCGADVHLGGECLFPLVEGSGDGWLVTAAASASTPVPCATGLLSAPHSAWAGHALVPAAGACPSAPDLAGLSAILRGTRGHAPGCGGAVVPAEGATWGDAVAALAAVRHAGGFPDASLGSVRAPAPPSCEDALVVSPAGEGPASSAE